MSLESARRNFVTKEITAENTYSEWVQLREVFNFSLSGTWEATIHVQRSYDGGTTPLDVDSLTENVEQIGYEPESAIFYRFGIKTGNYASGTVAGRLGQ